MTLSTFLDVGCISFDATYYAALVVFFLGVICWATKPASQDTCNYVRIGKPWLLQWWPGQRSMVWEMEKYIEEGYRKVWLFVLGASMLIKYKGLCRSTDR